MITPADTAIGVIGLGLMGKPIARNLLRKGFPVYVYNRSTAAMIALAQEGAVAASSPKALARASRVVITVLPDSPEVIEVLYGREDGVFAGARRGTLLIDMSTTAPAAAIQIGLKAQEHGLPFLDAPLSGGDSGAIAATLSIMVGGDRAAFERARPIFETLGKTIVYCGPAGSGQIVKACNQLMVASTMAALAEALVFGAKSGVAPGTILQVLSGGLAKSNVMDSRGPKMAGHDFTPGGKAKFMAKDLRIIQDSARELNAALPITAVVSALFTALLANGGGEGDMSSIVTVLENLSGHKLP